MSNKVPERFKIKIPEHMWARVPKGWYGFAIPDECIPLIIEFDEKMKKIAPNYQIHQIKEKYWTMRIYLGIIDEAEVDYDAYQALIDEYEEKGDVILKEIYKRFKAERDSGNS